jgi:hypothetical protein
MLRDSAPGSPAPAFTPVPVRSRRDGWTPERQRAFIAALAASQCIHRAAAAAGMSRESAYRLRARAGAESFAAAWDAILARRSAMPTAPALLWHRAFFGTIKPVIHGGGVVGEIRRPDNRALLSLMHKQDRSDRARAHLRARRQGRESSR